MAKLVAHCEFTDGKSTDFALEEPMALSMVGERIGKLVSEELEWNHPDGTYVVKVEMTWTPTPR